MHAKRPQITCGSNFRASAQQSSISRPEACVAGCNAAGIFRHCSRPPAARAARVLSVGLWLYEWRRLENVRPPGEFTTLRSRLAQRSGGMMCRWATPSYSECPRSSRFRGMNGEFWMCVSFQEGHGECHGKSRVSSRAVPWQVAHIRVRRPDFTKHRAGPPRNKNESAPRQRHTHTCLLLHAPRTLVLSARQTYMGSADFSLRPGAGH